MNSHRGENTSPPIPANLMWVKGNVTPDDALMVLGVLHLIQMQVRLGVEGAPELLAWLGGEGE